MSFKKKEKEKKKEKKKRHQVVMVSDQVKVSAVVAASPSLLQRAFAGLRGTRNLIH